MFTVWLEDAPHIGSQCTCRDKDTKDKDEDKNTMSKHVEKTNDQDEKAVVKTRQDLQSCIVMNLGTG
jgi:hypothetical protein